MNDGHEVLHHFLLWRKGLVVEDEQLTAILCTESLEPLKAKTAESVFVGDNEGFNLIVYYCIHHLVELSTFEVQPTTYEGGSA